MKKYNVTKLARLFEVHPNTIRLYERIGYIGKAVRKENNYREFTQKHVVQLKISRLVMAYPFTNQNIRNTGKSVISAVVSEEIDKAKLLAAEYIACIQKEIDLAEETERQLRIWVEGKEKEAEIEETDKTDKHLTRREIASWLGVTTEAVRNWERNELMHASGRGENHEVYFSLADKQRIRIIYMLRQRGYSMSAIYKCMQLYDGGCEKEILSVLHTANKEELLSAGDEWIITLKEVKNAAVQIPELIEALEKE